MLNGAVICVGVFSMITFKVVKEQHGWAIRTAEGVTTPFWSRDLAIRQAHCLADAIRCHGECAEVIIEGTDQSDPRKVAKGLSALGGRPATISGPVRAD
jgi:hypothetical protein